MIVGHNNYPKKPDNMSYYQTYYSPYRPPGPAGPTSATGSNHHASPSPHHHHNTHAFVPENDPSVLIARQKGMDEEQNKLPPIMAWNDYRSPYKPPQYHASPKMAHQQVN